MNEEEKKAVEELKILKNSEYSIMLTPHGADVFLTIIEKQQKENEQLRTEVNSKKKEIEELKSSMKNMYDEEVVYSIVADEFNLTKNEVKELFGDEDDKRIKKARALEKAIRELIKNSISKDKIKDEIRKAKNDYELFLDDYFKIKQKVLEELLEEK